MYIELKRKDINTKIAELKGIYFVYYLMNDDKIVYVGCSKSIYKRLKDHLWRRKQFDSVQMFSMPSQRTAKEKERTLIFKHKPEYNGNAKHRIKPVVLNSDKNRTTTPIDELKNIHSILNR